MKLFNISNLSNSSENFTEDSTEVPVTGKSRIKSKNRKRILLNSSQDKLTSKDITSALFQRFHNHRYMINNAYIFDWESDFFTVTESDYIYEIEIKISKSDFNDDFNKKDKHILLESQDVNGFLKKPNKFFYAVPKGLLTSFEIPSYAGLIEVHSGTEPAKVVKEAPFLHTNKILDRYKDTLLDKFSWRYKDFLLKMYQQGFSD